jgi:hypothetical protein
MVINREMRQAQMYSLGVMDEYGQEEIDLENAVPIQLTFGLYNHHDTEDVRYQDVEYTGLTHSVVSDKNIIQIGETKYKVKFVNPFGRLNQVFLITY